MSFNSTAQVPADAIAIIGMAGRFPGAMDVHQFWLNLLEGRESITFMTPEQLDPSVAKIASDPNYVRAKGILEDIDCFDAGFFGIWPMEAKMLDPQQRILLELAWTALEDAGYGADSRPDKIGVYVGTNWNRYLTINLAGNQEVLQQYGEFNAALANETDFPATRLSFRLNLTGPSISLYTACSTGLVAVAEAAKSLLNFECDMALAGGASISLPQHQGYLYSEGGMLSRDGHTRSFDADASGTTFNEGAGLVLLKRLEDAIEDRDHIYAVVRGCAVNNDGSDKMSFTAPSVTGQAEVIAAALAAANLEPDSVSFVETHGTATPIGDPIEIEALSRVYTRSASAPADSCVIGSLKSNVGHLIHAAGVAGLIKVALALKHGVIPATLHFNKPNPAINIEQTRFRVTAQSEPWIAGDTPRRGAVSSFGVGGTNAHVVVEESPLVPPGDEETAVPVILLSTQYPDGIPLLAGPMADRIAEDASARIGDIAYTLATGRRFCRHRLACVASDRNELVASLRAERGPRVVAGEQSQPIKRLAFAFPGQGAQRAGMGADLYRASEAFREAMDECLAVADAELDIDLRELTVGMTAEPEAGVLLTQTRYTQPALFAIGYALARHLERLGIRPDVMIGHSVGEFVAATLASVMTLEQGLRLVIERGRLMQSMPPGGMLAVGLPEAEALPICETHGLSVAAVNAPDLTVLSGELERIDAAMRELGDRNVRATQLRTSHAFHSAMMDPAVEAFGAFIGKMTLQKPGIPIVSTATGALLTDAEAISPAYWQAHLRRPVRFADALQTLLSQGACAMLELGPGGTLTGLAQRQAGEEHVFAASLDAKGISEPDAVMLGLARLWVRGTDVPWGEMFANETRSRLSLPTYPFRKDRHWVAPDPSAAPAPSTPPRPVADSELERLIGNQLELMSRQLAILAGSAPDEIE